MNFTISKLLITVAALGLSLGAYLIPAHPDPPARITAVTRAFVGRDIPDPMIEVFAVAEAHVASVLSGISAEVARAAEYVASIPAPVPSRAPQPAPESATGGSGPHTDAWWSGVATCEQGGRNDPYYGYFSFMDGSAGGKTWDEQVQMGNDLLVRAGREVGPWAAACVAAGYAASPSG